MLRGLIYALLSILLITFIRGVVGILTKGVGDLFKEEQAAKGPGGKAAPREVGGELLKDPVCGTYVSSNSAFKRTVGGKTHVFCSEKCRDQFAA
ncbi:MAG: YHS domain-containing protein [Acidobacteriota bacterium]